MPALLTLVAALLLAVPGIWARPMPEAVVPAECEVTLPNSARPEEIATSDWPVASPEEGVWYGKAGLYAHVSPDGVVEAQLDRDRGGGWFATEWVQDAQADEIHEMYAALEFDVRRVGAGTFDEPADVDTPAFAPIGRVQTAGVWVPEGGCWEITATATNLNTSGRTQLPITAWVVIPALEPIVV